MIVYELDPGTTKVVAVDPERAMVGHGAPELKSLAAEVRAKLARVIDAL